MDKWLESRGRRGKGKEEGNRAQSCLNWSLKKACVVWKSEGIVAGIPGTRDPVHWAGSGRPQPWCWGAVSSHGGFILESNGSD